MSSTKFGGDSSCSSDSLDINNFLFKWFLQDVTTACNFVAAEYACIDENVKYFLPKPFNNFK